jgi:sugar phosphate isomerase/epimerase
MCNELFESWEWDRTCAYLKELGYTGLEVAPFTLAPRADQIDAEQRKQTRQTAERHGLEVLGLHWLLAKVPPPDLHLIHPDPAVRERTARYFIHLVHLCADLGGDVLVIGSPKQRSLLPGVSPEQATDYAIDVLSPSLPIAADRNVTLALEPLTPSDTDFITTADQAIALIDRVGHPNFKLNLDVRAMSSESRPIPDVIRSARGHIAHVQVNDPNNLGPGMGDVRYDPIIEALRDVNYDGWLSVEAFDFSPGPEKIARESIAYLKRVTG